MFRLPSDFVPVIRGYGGSPGPAPAVSGTIHCLLTVTVLGKPLAPSLNPAIALGVGRQTGRQAGREEEPSKSKASAITRLMKALAGTYVLGSHFLRF